MAYNYLGLVNDINKRVNEVSLTSANFATATGFYDTAKTAINSAIRQINQDQFNWPFNHILEEETLVAGDVRYPYPEGAKVIDFNTFRIKRNATFGNDTQRLSKKDYEQFLDQNADWEYNTSTSIRRLPSFVCQAPGREFIIGAPPDNAYELVFEYYMLPVDLILYTDVPTVPEAFRHVITDGAMYYVYLFRGDKDSAMIGAQKFTKAIESLKSIYINRYEYLRDTRVHQTISSNALNTLRTS